MPLRIEDYALIGDCRTCALVGRDGSIDWFCAPRFDCDACFAALLGDEENGFWRIAPATTPTRVTRRYREGTLTVETEFVTEQGVVAVIDLMAWGAATPTIVRIVEGRGGVVDMRIELAFRLGFGKVIPWVRRIDGGLEAIAGPDRLVLQTPAWTRGEGLRTISEIKVREGEHTPFVLTWSPSHHPLPAPIDPYAALAQTEATWRAWHARARVDGPYDAVIRRSLVTLKALTYAPTGGIVAAPTTSLPEAPGGVRNWDYRFCWLRDSTFTLYALLSAGYMEEAAAWRDWLLRAAAGAPSQLQILYGVAGERRHVEIELPWLAGHLGSKPVRIGNGATEQSQLDVYGELVDTLFLAKEVGLTTTETAWGLERALIKHLETAWREPDNGIWEVRGPLRHFTHSKVMCWVAFDRGVKAVERWGLEAPVDDWRRIRDEIHADVCTSAYDASLGHFVQHYGSRDPDASLLLLLHTGFLPPDDPRMIGTVEAVQKKLVVNGLVMRYPTRAEVDGLPPGEGAFLACSFWLADALVLLGRREEARELFERLIGYANDAGLLAEELDPVTGALLGNFPQALSHVALVNTAINLSRRAGPAERRSRT
ncbi:MAG TPA: glycoside hydrolase family 15 protein [Labilithrix sp.]|jgi:GH15 family glucan-1,4-alpha-glucosidase